MPRVRARTLTEAEKTRLLTLKENPNQEVSQRAHTVLLSATTEFKIREIAEATDMSVTCVLKWIKLFNEDGLAGIEPVQLSKEKARQIVRLANSMIARGQCVTLETLRMNAIRQGVVESLNSETVRRVLRQAGFRPERNVQWHKPGGRS